MCTMRWRLSPSPWSLASVWKPRLREALGPKARHNDGLRRAWYWACKEESIDPKAPSRLPLLFALDAKFAIPNGFTYVPDCSDIGQKSDAGGTGGGTYLQSYRSGTWQGDGFDELYNIGGPNDANTMVSSETW